MKRRFANLVNGGMRCSSRRSVWLHALAIMAVWAAIILPAVHRHSAGSDAGGAPVALESHCQSPTPWAATSDCDRRPEIPARPSLPDDPNCPICHWIHLTGRGVALLTPTTSVPLEGPVYFSDPPARESLIFCDREALAPARAPPQAFV